MYQITRKTFLARNLKRLQRLYPSEFDFFPRTWILPSEMNELRAFAFSRPKKTNSTANATITPKRPMKLDTANKSSSLSAAEDLSSASPDKTKELTAEEMAAKVKGYLEGSTTRNALEAAKNAPLPPRVDEESSDEN